MNRKQRRLSHSSLRKDSLIHFQGRSYSLGEALTLAVERHQGKQYRETEELYRLILAKYPDHVPALNNLGMLLHARQNADAEEIISLLRRAIEVEPQDALALYNLGDALSSAGKMKEAEEIFARALAITPHSPRIWLSLAKIRKYTTADHPDIAQIRYLIDHPEFIPPGTESLPYFALGKIYDDCGLYDEAFAAYSKGNALRNAGITYDAPARRGRTDAIIETFSKEFLSRNFPFPSESEQPLFIVGMPRSGTTLLASILSNHRDIESSGEILTLIEAAAELPQRMENDMLLYPQAALFMTPPVASGIIKDYEKRLRRGINSSLPYIIDKHPINFWHLGFIAMLFPRARIIHCMRNPLDTCLSNYFQNFDDSYDYSFDLGNLGFYYSEYSRLMAHWRAALPRPMLEIRYEELVSDMEGVVKKMLDFLGLEWDERCLAPHTNPRPMATSSMWQVRQPVYRGSLERWRHYEKHLGPLKEALVLPMGAKAGGR